MNATTDIYYILKDRPEVTLTSRPEVTYGLPKTFLIRIDAISDNELFCIVSVYDASAIDEIIINEKQKVFEESTIGNFQSTGDNFQSNNDIKSLSDICLKKIELNMQIQTKENLLHRFEATEVFIGEDQTSIDIDNTNENSTNDDSTSDTLVSSVLIKLFGTSEYVYIGDCIFSFETDSHSHIIDFHTLTKNQIATFNDSNVSNTNICAYAIDMNNRCYLMNEHVIMKTDSDDLNYWNSLEKDPYEYYYNISLITNDIRYVLPKEPVHRYFEEINKFYINNKEYTLRYSPNPEKEYDKIISEHSNNGYKPFISVTDTEKISYGLSKEQYVDIIKEFGNLISCKPLSVKIINKS
jgi:hypothetical protein